MSARPWPAGRPGDLEAKTASDPTPTVDLSEMAPERVHERARELEDGLRAARRERDEAAVEVATGKGRLIEAAGRGFEAAKTVQRQIAEAEERLRTAALVTEAVELAHRPFAAESHRLRREQRRVEMTGELAAAVAARDRVDGELIAAIEALRVVAERRLAATEAAVEIEKRAASEDLPVGAVERHILPAHLREALRRVPLSFAS